MNSYFSFFIYILCIFYSSLSSGDTEPGTEVRSKLFLSFNTDKNQTDKKHRKETSLTIYYLGIEYIVPINEYFGGQCLLNAELETKYYVLVSRNIESIKRKSIHGHKVNNQENSRLYLLNLLTDSKKGDLTYNWEINEISIPKRQLPEKTIIIYANPETVEFKQFDKNFNHPYPSKQSKFPLLMLPPCRVDVENLINEEHKNNICALEVKQNHVTVTETANNTQS